MSEYKLMWWDEQNRRRCEFVEVGVVDGGSGAWGLEDKWLITREMPHKFGNISPMKGEKWSLRGEAALIWTWEGQNHTPRPSYVRGGDRVELPGMTAVTQFLVGLWVIHPPTVTHFSHLFSKKTVSTISFLNGVFLMPWAFRRGDHGLMVPLF